jgi:hypothetical protein
MLNGDETFQSTNVSLSPAMPPPLADRREGERELAILRVAKLITDAGEELCRIRNISAGGIMAETTISHAEGTRIVVELRSDQRLKGTVTWSSAEGIGIRFDDSVDVAQVLAKKFGDNRLFARQPRVLVPCVARLRIGAKLHKVHVTDISQGGMKVAIDDPACIGWPVSVTVDGLPRIEGVIRWFHDDYAGIAFKTHVPFDQLTHWLGMRLAGCRARVEDGSAAGSDGYRGDIAKDNRHN